MSKSRKTPKIVNFDGESLSMTRDVYQFSSRRRKTLLARLRDMPGLDEAGPESFAYQDDRGRLLGVLTLEKTELMVDSNSSERAERMSKALLAACEGLLTFSHRVEHDELLAQTQDAGFTRSLDTPIGGRGIELLEDPEIFAQLQAQMPPGVDLRQLVNSDGSQQDGFDYEFDDFDDEGEVLDGFQTIGLRVDLLDLKEKGLYWMLKAPDWLTLGNLHRILSTLLGRSPLDAHAFHFPYQSYDSQDKGETHPDLITLRRAFEEVDQAFYGVGNPVWGFLIRRTRVFSLCRGAVELVRTEPFPPGDCTTPAEYLQGLETGSLPRSMPFELLERHLQAFLDPSASRVGPYHTIGMNLPNLLVAILLARKGEPASAFELTHRALLSDCETDVTVAAIRRTTKKSPFLIAEDDRIRLDQDSPAYSKAVSALRKFLAPEGPRLMVRRFTSQTMFVEGEPPDIVLVVDDGPGLAHGCQACHVADGVSPMIDAVNDALSKTEAVSVVTDDPLARLRMSSELDCFVEFSLSVDEPLQAFLALEKAQREDSLAAGGYCYPSGLSEAQLGEFFAASHRYYLLSPWVFLSDSDLFEIVGLTLKPLIVSVLGQGHEVYGLGLFEGKGKYERFKEGDANATFAFMDYLEATHSEELREQARQAGVTLIDNDTCPFAYGVRQPANVAQFRVLTKVLNLICDRVSELGEVEPGTTETTDAQGRLIRLTYPLGDEPEKPSTAAAHQPSKPGRNDPCWCGSGKKYKKCHLGIDG